MHGRFISAIAQSNFSGIFASGEGRNEQLKKAHGVPDRYSQKSQIVLYTGDRLELLAQIPSGEARLVVTSPPYNIGKKYEKRLLFEHYLTAQAATLAECARILADDGSLCWQVGNHIARDGEIFPLDVYIYKICKDSWAEAEKSHHLVLRARPPLQK